MSRSKSLSELTISEAIVWRDQDAVQRCEEHIALCREWIRAFGKRDTHAARYARETLRTEIARVEASLAAKPSIEAERTALAKADAAWLAHLAEPLPTEVDGELLRQATRAVLDRARVTAYRAFVAAAQRSCVRVPQDPRPAWARASVEVADVVAKVPELEKSYWGGGYTNRALELAELTGRGYADTHAIGPALYAVAACEHDRTDAARALLDVMWFFLCRKAGIKGAELPDLSRWEKVA
jgi:hypothetical protein